MEFSFMWSLFPDQGRRIYENGIERGFGEGYVEGFAAGFAQGKELAHTMRGLLSDYLRLHFGIHGEHIDERISRLDGEEARLVLEETWSLTSREDIERLIARL